MFSLCLHGYLAGAGSHLVLNVGSSLAACSCFDQDTGHTSPYRSSLAFGFILVTSFLCSFLYYRHFFNGTFVFVSIALPQASNISGSCFWPAKKLCFFRHEASSLSVKRKKKSAWNQHWNSFGGKGVSQSKTCMFRPVRVV